MEILAQRRAKVMIFDSGFYKRESHILTHTHTGTGTSAHTIQP